MKIVISPAKSLDFEKCIEFKSSSECIFLSDSEKLIKKTKKLSIKKIGALMSISPALSQLNYDRFQNWSLPFTKGNSKHVLAVFKGDVYRGINVDDFTENEISLAQDKLRILSGLYGLLKPMDLMQAYRLEMGTRFAITPKIKNLYQFWGNKITDALNVELARDDGVLINLASNEYFKAVNVKRITGKVITCHFRDFKNGEYKMIMTFAKLARGYMTRFIIKNNLKQVDGLKAFEEEGYVYNPKLSTENEFTFTRG
ncbi:MAG: peroxide stress protein YaaA [Flavobacteriales bacterium]|nr:peroxide stress protein YaaA [Flavobacteriales bacterium]